MLIAHLSLTYFLLPVSRRFPSAAHLLSLIEGPRLELERFSSKLSGSGSAGAARRRTSVRRARRAPRRARSTTRKSALVRGGLLRADDELDPAIRGAAFDRGVVGDRVA